MAVPLKNDYGLVCRDSLEDEALNTFEDNAFVSEKHNSFSFKQSVLCKHRLTFLNIVLLFTQLTLIGWYFTQIIPPKSGSIQMEYGRDYDYMSLDHKYDHLWEQDVAANEAGIIILKEHNGRYREIEHGAISMFHELHCLQSIRKALQAGWEKNLVAMDWRLSPHWPHCLWYLRQSIMCNANGHIERETEFNGSSGFIDGAEDRRQCGSTAPLYELYAEKGVPNKITE